MHICNCPIFYLGVYPMDLPEEESEAPSETFKDYPLSVYEVQIALHDSIKNHKGGLKAVWKAIDPQFKKPEENSTSSPIDEYRINEEAFRRAFNRLTTKTLTTEKMSFGLRGNFLLLMNVFQILGIKEFSDLTKMEFQKPDIEAVIHDSNIKAGEIQKRLEEIIETLEMSKQRTTRFPALKVCRDWEAVLMSLNHFLFSDFRQTDSLSINNWFLCHFNSSIQMSYFFYYILKAHREYFSQDRLLHSFYKRLGNTLVNISNDTSIVLTPLYILYFILLIHRKFLSVLLSIESYSPFINVSLDEHGNHIKNVAFEKITEGDTGKYLLKQNNDILQHLKNIIPLLLNGNKIPDVFDFFSYLRDIVGTLFNIYSYHVDYSPDSLMIIMESVKTIEDLYKRMSMGNPHFYYISQAHIEKVLVVKNKLATLENSIERSHI